MESIPVMPQQQQRLLNLAQMNQLLQYQQLLQQTANNLPLSNNSSTGISETKDSTSNGLNNLGLATMPSALSTMCFPTNPLAANGNFNNFTAQLPTLPSLQPNLFTQPWQLSNLAQKKNLLPTTVSKIDSKVLPSAFNKTKPTYTVDKPVTGVKRSRTTSLYQDENVNQMNSHPLVNLGEKVKTKLEPRRQISPLQEIGVKDENAMNKLEQFTIGNQDRKLPLSITAGNIKLDRRGYKVGKRIKLTQEDSNKCLTFLDKEKSSTKPRNFECTHPGCKKRFAWKWSMETHARTHKGEAGRIYKCSFCKKGFFTVGCLKSHEKIHTRTPNAFPCKVPGCGKNYSTSEGLRLHTRNHHQVDKKWRCPVIGCPRSFVRQADLRLHIIRIHTEERPFPCTVKGCTKGFACYSELKRHQQVHVKRGEISSVAELEKLKPKPNSDIVNATTSMLKAMIQKQS